MPNWLPLGVLDWSEGGTAALPEVLLLVCVTGSTTSGLDRSKGNTRSLVSPLRGSGLLLLDARPPGSRKYDYVWHTFPVLLTQGT